jgi:hypothetical protein
MTLTPLIMSTRAISFLQNIRHIDDAPYVDSPRGWRRFEINDTDPIDRILLAEVLDTSVDFLIGGHHNAEPPIQNARLIQRFQTVEGFDKEERELVIQVLDAMIAKHNMASTLKAMEG